MRKLSLFLLLASCAMPAMAQEADDGDRRSRSEARGERSESRAQRAERPERAERMERRESRERPQQVQVERQVQAEGPRIQRYQQQELEQQGREGGRDERLQRYREHLRESGQQAEGGALVPRERRIRTIPTTTPQVGQTGPVRTDVRIQHRRDRDDRNRWTNHWRTDHRYDWRRHRDRHRSIFRIGFYFDPFGYSYRRFGLGSYLYPSYYQSNYWINDPWQYRLPPAYGPYRWVRYHNDAILIDTWTGEVVDVVYGFFW